MNPETRSVFFPADGHPDENQLLLGLERELPSEESAKVEQHLGKCWNCRARSEKMQRGILAFVEYRDKRYLPSLPPPPNDYSDFQRRLRNVGAERPRAGLLARIWHRLFSALEFPRHVRWAGVMAGIMAFVLLWTQVFRPPVLSANDLLMRAMAAQNPTSGSETVMPVRIARQKLQIRCARQTVVRDFEWVVGRPIPRGAWRRQSDPLQWGTPLTAAAFADWRGSLKGRSDNVERSGDYYTIRTASTNTFITQASMVVRASDFHPVEQHLRFADNRQLDLREIKFEILDQPIGEQRLAAPVQTAQAESVKLHQSDAVAARNLDETELLLRYTLFTHRWDLGEDLRIERGADRVTMSGIVSSRERAEAMHAALDSLSNVRFLFRAPSTLSGEPSRSQTVPAAEAQTRSSDPLLNTELADAFPSREDRQAFVDRCLVVSDAALSHAWVLKQLADRYSPAAEQSLGSESQAKLRNMLRGHLEELSRASASLGPLVEMAPASRATAAVVVEDWRKGVVSLFEQVRQQDKLVADLVAGARADGIAKTAALEEFCEDHKSIDATVRGSLRDLSGDGRQ